MVLSGLSSYTRASFDSSSVSSILGVGFLGMLLGLVSEVALGAVLEDGADEAVSEVSDEAELLAS